MEKHFLLRAARGLTAGLAINFLVCLVSSYALRLGYFAPCFTALAEPCGGELNAALVQAAAFGGIGALLRGAVRLRGRA